MKLLDTVLDLIFPPTCEFCGKVGQYICNECYLKIKKYEIQSITNKTHFALYKYKGKMRELIIKYKFNDKSYLSKLFANLIIKNKKMCKIIKSYDIIISVPLHKKRKLERGYNQSYLIIKELAKKMELNARDDVLIKVKNIKPQSEKGYMQRKVDILHAFKVQKPDLIKNKTVLLFDDVYTTGSTTNECKKMLLKAGACSVEILTLTQD